MDLDIRWKNFRCFEDTGWIKLRPITLLIGANNSGKTSIIDPLLLLKQSITLRDRNLALKTKGELVNLGDFEDLVRNHNSRGTISLGLKFLPKPSGKNKKSAIGKQPPGMCEVSFRFDKARQEIVLERYYVEDVSGRRLLERRRNARGNYSILGFPAIKRSRKEYLAAIKKAKPERFLFTSGPIFRIFVEASEKRKSNRSSISIPLGPSLYLRIVEWVKNRLYKGLTNISYIGPLREHPQRTYEVSGETPGSVGIRGEFAPEIIFRKQNDEFCKKVNVWIQRFDFGKGLHCAPLNKNTFTVKLIRKDGVSDANLADTGFGISQILPLIVEGLYAKKDSLIIAEQPEIHLNPSLQTKLADLFCTIAKSGRRMLIETHSEHLVLRLRRLIAEGFISHKDVGLYYVNKQKGKSSVKEIVIQPNGHIENGEWPVGFFEDSLREALGLAMLQGRKTKHAK